MPLPQNWTIFYISLSLSFNIIISVAIVGRLLYLRRLIKRALFEQGTFGHDTQYTNVAAMTIESSSMACTFSVFVIALLACSSPVVTLFSQALPQVQVSSTLFSPIYVLTWQF
jgi:hypothetical protein